ncbi:UvrD-helicase domain-containing protein [Candidatus Thioglobus sp.]|uniref:UvrD-helicase domain-containing protein n=1 Tax=Candidatus Thioglobus sp. TaxID=2026721 RepID=UPI00261E75F1|nr:UvrD-helicase domain-containing protein [Candidatus Thioglobus sp.]MDG2395875.1 UvrD-helicase domain-containing protein [Candidatus Thioglobus sp.]
MDDQAQRLQALDTSSSFLIQAPAGSGKTELLTQRYLKLLSVSDSPESVLAMTFTKKAVSELKARVIDALKSARGKRPNQAHKQITYDLACEVLSRSAKHDWQLIEMPQRLKISTIDGLSNLITSRYPQQDTWINKQIITQTWQQDNIYLQAAKHTLNSIDTDEFGQCVRNTLLYLDNNVNRFYQLVTFMLSKRDQWLNKLYVEGVFNVKSLKNSASNIINQHLEQLLILAQSHFTPEFFSALGGNTQIEISSISQLPRPVSDDLENWKILADLCLTGKGEWRKTLTKKNGFPAELKQQKKVVLDVLTELSSQTELKTLLGEISLLPDVDFDTSKIQALENIAQVLKVAVAQLTVLFDEQQSTDFIQVALDADQALSNHESSDVALFLDYKIQHLLIDEFQDTSNTQFILIEKLIANWQEAEPKTLFLVGDPMQSIYLFRQSQVGLFLQVRELGISHLKPKFLQLTTNFRSDKVIVEANNTYFSKIFPQVENTQIGSICYSSSVSNNAASQKGGVEFYPFACKDYTQEAQQVSELVQQNINKDVAILVRNRSHLNEIVPALKSAGVTFEALKTAPLKNELFTKDLISLTRGLLDLSDKLAWLAILRAPWCGLLLPDILTLSRYQHHVMFDLLALPEVLEGLSVDARPRVKALRQAFSAVVANTSRFSFVQRIEFVIQQLCPQQSLDEKQTMIKRQFLAVVHDCEMLGQLDISTIEQQLEELYAPSITSNIKLMTIHQSKGLEFEVVIIPGLGRAPRANQPAIIRLQEFSDQSLLLAPIKSYQDVNPSGTYRYLQHIESQQGHFESMRLLYVAMTRAKSNLFLLGTLNSNNKASNNTFLKLLEPILHHQFDKTPKILNVVDVALESPPLVRYRTIQNVKSVVDNAHEVVDFNQSVDLGYKSLLGTFMHQCYEFSEFDISLDVISMRLIELGFSLDSMDTSSNHIRRLLLNTRNDIHFKWLFKERQSTEVEAEFIYKDKSIVIDRLFIESGTLWIVDFKTAEPRPGETTERYIARQRSKYAEQLKLYKEALTNSHKGEIKCALYCPTVSQLIEITH